MSKRLNDTDRMIIRENLRRVKQALGCTRNALVVLREFKGKINPSLITCELLAAETCLCSAVMFYEILIKSTHKKEN